MKLRVKKLCDPNCSLPIVSFRKRKRHVLEEEESMDEDEYNKLKEADSDLMPGDFELPEDTTG